MKDDRTNPDVAKKLAVEYGLEYVTSAPQGETIVDMVMRQNDLYIATRQHVYVLKGKV